ncbi:hypothetical protein ACWPKS_08865 [Coraliomargarita sp. W4R72]
MKLAFTRLTYCLFLSALTASTSRAELLSYEPFEYNDGDTLTDLSGGEGWDGAWYGSGSATVISSDKEVVYQMGASSYGGGRSLQVSGGSTVSAAVRQIESDDYDSGGADVYVSMLFRLEGGTGTVTPNRYAGWSSLDSGFSAVVDNTAVLNAGSKVGARVNYETSSVDQLLHYDETYMLVMRFGDWDGVAYRSMRVWLNPECYDESISAIDVTAEKLVTAGGSDGFIGLNLRTSGLASDIYYFDDIRIGTAWRDVIPLGAQIGESLADRIDDLTGHLLDPVVAASITSAEAIADGLILTRPTDISHMSNASLRVVDSSAKYEVAMTEWSNASVASQYAFSVSDAASGTILSEELPLLAAAYRLTSDPDILDYLERQLEEVLTWDYFQRTGWTIGSHLGKGEPAPSLVYSGVWLGTGSMLQALSLMFEVLPAGALPVDLEDDIKTRMGEEIELTYYDWTNEIPWYTKNGGKLNSNQWIVPASGLVAAASLDRATYGVEYEYGVDALSQSLELTGLDGSLGEGFGYGLTWTSLSFILANHYMVLSGDDRFANDPFFSGFPEWACSGFMPGESIVNAFDFYESQYGRSHSMNPDATQLAALYANSPLAWVVENWLGGANVGFYGLLLRESELAAIDLPVPKLWGNYELSSMFIWREDISETASAMWLRGGSTSDFHNHHDIGHVNYTVGGVPVFIEAGTPGYAALNKKTDYDSAVGHNVWRMNGDIYPKKNIDSQVEMLSVSDSDGSVQVDLSEVYPELDIFSRKVTWTPTMLIIYDTFSALVGTTVEPEMTLHLATQETPTIVPVADPDNVSNYLITVPAGTIVWGANPSVDDFQAKQMRIRVLANAPISVTATTRVDHTLRFRKAANLHTTLEISTVSPVSDLAVTIRSAITE